MKSWAPALTVLRGGRLARGDSLAYREMFLSRVFKKSSTTSEVKVQKKKVIGGVRGLKVKSRKFRILLKSLGRVLFRSSLLRVFLIGIVISGLIILARYFLFSPNFNLQAIEVEGDEELEKSFIEERLDYLLGQNIFFIRGSRLQSEVEKFSPYIKTVRVEKELPDKIIVTLEEREPSFTWINLSGIYLVDSEGMVLEVIKDLDNLDLSEEDMDLLKGYGDLSDLTDDTSTDSTSSSQEGSGQEGQSQEEGEEEENFFSEAEGGENEEQELSHQEKLEVIEEKRTEVVSKVDHFWEQSVSGSEQDDSFPFVFSYEMYDYRIYDELEYSLVSATRAGLEVDFLGEEPVKYLWESNYRFVIYLVRWRKIVFSTRRDFRDQIEDLQVLLGKLQNEGKSFGHIDLSSEIIVYEFEE